VCGRTVEVAERSVEAWAERVGAEHGFRDIAHLVEIVGTCDACGPSAT
jgi:Fur family ferric uptake transcriptional regulator